MNSKILSRSQGLEYLLMKACLLSLEDLTSLLMENYSYCLQVFGIKVHRVDLNIVVSSTVKTTSKNHHLSCQRMANQL